MGRSAFKSDIVSNPACIIKSTSLNNPGPFTYFDNAKYISGKYLTIHWLNPLFHPKSFKQVISACSPMEQMVPGTLRYITVSAMPVSEYILRPKKLSLEKAPSTSIAPNKYSLRCYQILVISVYMLVISSRACSFWLLISECIIDNKIRHYVV